ncbi:cytochrome P450 [Pilatotrama ljubarskyi]|nr:cytochrome P450 [Pilatotrama ljubarskyi]
MMEGDVALALACGVAAFLVLRGRMLQGDIAAAILAGLYLCLGGAYSIYHPEWGVVKTLLHPAYLLSVSFAATWTCFIAYRVSPLHPLYKFPGPLLNRITELPVAYKAARLVRHTYLCELHEKYGPVVRIAPHAISINSKSAAYTIYKSAQCFNKTDAYDLHLKGEGLFFVKDRDRHAVRRRPWNRALSANAIKEYAEPLFWTARGFVDRLLKDTDEKGVADLVRVTTHWAFDTSGSPVSEHIVEHAFISSLQTLTTFGGSGTEMMSLLTSDDPAELAEKPRVALLSFDFFSHFPWLFHIMKHLPSAVFRQVEEFSLAQAERRLQAEKIHFRDIFSYWIEDAEHPNVDELATESLAAIIAATETVSSMTALVFYFILSNPPWVTRLTTELSNAFTPSTPLTPSTIDLLDALPVLTAVINEAFRLGAIFSGLARVVPKGGATIDGHYLPEGTAVSVPIYAQHVSEENFGSDPRVFDPQRWLEGKVDKGALMTFGAGAFGCVGQRLAYKQTRLILACMFLLLDVRPADSFDPKKFWAGVGNLRATVISEPLEVVGQRRENAGQCVVFPSAL